MRMITHWITAVGTAVVFAALTGASCGASPSTSNGGPTPARFPSISWSATAALPGDANGNVEVKHVSAGAYVVHMTGCRRSATLTGGDATGNPFAGLQITLYDGQTVNVPGDGDYTVSAPDNMNLACAWTATLAPK